MYEGDIKWVTENVNTLCSKHSYDSDMVYNKFCLVDSNIGVSTIRSMLTDLLIDHHYDLVAFFAEFLLKDNRTSYQALGKTFKNKCAKAPKESPSFLRLRDRANAGLSCFRAKVVVSNPWTRGAGNEVRLLKLFAKTQDEAIEMARNQGFSIVPGGRIVDIQVSNVVDDDDVDKAEVVQLRLWVEGGSLPEVVETSFTAANKVLNNWTAHMRPEDRMLSTHIEVKWESEDQFKFIIAIYAAKAHIHLDIAGMIKEQIAFVVDKIPYTDRSAQENARFLKEMLTAGALPHCLQIRSNCLLYDRRSFNAEIPDE